MALSENTAIIESFEKLGLSTNEAKVYLALLENHPITGYQLSKISGILRPIVYEMLTRLMEKGGARIVKSNPDSYIPAEFEEFLRNIEIDFSDARKNIASVLKETMVIDDSDFFWNITGIKNIVNSVAMMIERSEKEIYINVQNQEIYNSIYPGIEEKLKSGIKAEVFSYYLIDTMGITLYSYKLESEFQSAKIFPNHLSISIDGTESIIANFSDDKTAKAVFSKNTAQVNIVQESIIHQIYLVRLWRYLGSEKMKTLINNEDRKFFEDIEKHLSLNRS